MTLHVAPNDPRSAPYAYAARIYRDLGWQGVLPLPSGRKSSPPTGYTGEDGAWPTDAEVTGWVHQQPTGNVGLRLPDGIIGIDVDHHDAKHGGDTITEAEQRLGPLPPTWISTARAHPSGIRFYRVPSGRQWRTIGPWVDILQRKHRYACVWPSTNPEADGAAYLWLAPGGEISSRPPSLDEPTLLPTAWVDALDASKTLTVAGPTSAGRRDHDRRAPAVDRALANSLADLYANRHDTATAGVMALVRLHSQDYPGADDALDSLRTAFLNAVTADGSRSQNEAEAEWQRMVTTAQTKVATSASTIPRWEDRTSDRVGVSAFGWASSASSSQPDAPVVDEPWPEPEPLEPELLNGPPFPVHALPTWMSEAAEACAEALQAPVDLPAILALGALSTITMGHINVHLPDSDGWTEPTNLYVVVALPPGEAKSPAFKAMLNCVRQLEADLVTERTPLIREAEVTKEILVKRAKAAREAAALPGKGIEDAKEAAQLQAEADTVAVPPLPRLVADDATPEALVTLMAKTNERIALMSSEGGLFDMMAGQYADKGKTASLDIYLKGWSGDSINQDRVGRDAVALQRPLVSVCVTPQPILVKRIGENTELAGRGVSARFLYSIPSSNVGMRDRTAVRRRTNPGARRRYEDEILRIGRKLSAWVMPAQLNLSDEAADAFIAWDQAHEDRLAPGHDLAHMAEWMMKLRAAVLRVSGLLHIAEGVDHAEPIALETIERAFVLAGYWIEHARCVHASWASAINAVARPARLLMGWAVEEQLESFTQREAYLKLRSRDNKVKTGDAVEVLQQLIEMGWLRADGEFPGHRGKTATLLVHPQAAQALHARHAHDAQPVDDEGELRVMRVARKGVFLPTHTPSSTTDPSRSEHSSFTRNAHDAQVEEASAQHPAPPPVAEPGAKGTSSAAPAAPSDDEEFGDDYRLY